MEVHPPEHGIHTWRDFFVHMGTICLGLLIAIGLEQTVEWVHRRHEAAELREELQRESQGILSDADGGRDAAGAEWQSLDTRLRLVKTALWEHKPMPGQELSKRKLGWQYPIDATYSAAQTNGLTSVLSRDEIYIYSLLHEEVHWAYTYERALEETADKRLQFEDTLPNQSGQLDLAHVAPDDLKKYADLITAEMQAATRLHWECGIIKAIASAISHGERNPEKVGEISADAVGKDGERP